MKPINYDYWKVCEGKDADSCNPDLRVAMNQLYAKKTLPNGGYLDFGKIENENCNATYEEDSDKIKCSPDAYSSYASPNGKWKDNMPFKMKCIEKNKDLADEIYRLSGTIAGEFFFPCKKKDGNTINQTRGTTLSIADRIDLTLRDIKSFYDKKEEYYPLKEVLNRYKDFFDAFKTFKGYIDYCLLNDFCTDDYEVILWKKEEGLPKDETELVSFWNWSIEKLEARAKTIEKYAKDNGIEIEETASAN